MSSVHGGYSHQERSAGQEVRPVSVQLFADLQDVFTAHRVSPDDMQENHKLGPQPGDASGAHRSGHVSSQLWPLWGHVLGELISK